MREDKGSKAVLEHATEAGIAEDISLIAKFFDLDDVAIFTPGRLSYIKERPRKTQKIAVATKQYEGALPGKRKVRS